MIEVRGKFDSSIMKALMSFQFRRLRWFFLFFALLFPALGALCIVAGDIESGVFIIVMGLLFFPLLWILTPLAQKAQEKSMKMLSEETENIFKFSADRFYQETNRGELLKSTVECCYTLIYNAFETKSHFFLFISKMQAHVIPKKDITQGTAEQLSELLAVKIGKKYKKINMK